MRKLWDAAVNFIRHLLSWRILVGRDVRFVAGPAVVLFPLLPATLCCGLAGIVVLRRAARPAAQEDLAGLFEQAAAGDLAALLAGRIAPEGYLAGKGHLGRMEEQLFCLKQEEGFQGLFFSPDEAERLTLLCRRINDFLRGEEALLPKLAERFSSSQIEEINDSLVLMRDIVWGLERDVLANIARIVQLAGASGVSDVAPAALAKYRKLNFLLNCLDRLEVRGRDSAGIELFFSPADRAAMEDLIDSLPSLGLAEQWQSRSREGDMVNGSLACAPVFSPPEEMLGLSFTYKTASIIGDLGRNVRQLRDTIAADGLLKTFAPLRSAFETAFAHTRWASVGSITEENCHPLNNFTTSEGRAEADRVYPRYGRGRWFIHAVLNGDVDNYQGLRAGLGAEGRGIAPEVTTDTKIIPLQIERYLLAGCDLLEAFRRAVNDFEGSHAIAMVSNTEPEKVFLALRGSGQSLYVGIAPDRYVFSSELYGLVEETPFFVKMDGEAPSPQGASGQIFVLSQDSEGGPAGIKALWYDGTPLSLGERDVQKAEITTRDIDRGDYPHFFLKEISESIHSVRKTLLGKYRLAQTPGGARVVFTLGDDVVPARIREAMQGGRIRRIVVTGHGTAAVAGQAVAQAMQRHLAASGIAVEAKVASELSGFFLAEPRPDTLVIAITQSGTTTDTNRAVAMAVQQGAFVIAVVNRRQSDITAKAHGVFYTSDGRDIEMAVASTKAFYSQIVAGSILSLFLAQLVGALPDERVASELSLLEGVPAAMEEILSRREEIGRSAEGLARKRRYWAVVGSGPNLTAAEEIRIKLSELCYKTISADIIENKKHIDLSAEPLIVVCAAGNPEAVTADAVKDVAIFKAHKAAVVVFADQGEERFQPVADAVIPIPRSEAPLCVILNTLAGHLFGYYAACSIDEEALFLRNFKSRLNLLMVEQERRGLAPYERLFDPKLRRLVNDFSGEFVRRKNRGDFAHSSPRTVADLLLLLKYAAGKLPWEELRCDFPGEGEEASPLELLDITLGRAVDELSRPIDAIRHQAKTVTVGTSRREIPLRGVIADLLAELGFTTKSLLRANLISLGLIQRAVREVRGFTLYAIEGLGEDGRPGDGTTIAVLKRGGVAQGMASRAEKPRQLMGTKKGIVASGRLYAGQGKADGASIVVIPLLGETGRISRLLLVHVAFEEGLAASERREILGEERVAGIRDLVQEYNLPWQDEYLKEVPLGLLLGEPVELIAGMIRELFGGTQRKKGQE